MLRWILFIGILLLPFLSEAQLGNRPGEINFNHFVGSFGMSQELIMDYMSLNGFEFDSGAEETEDNYAALRWAYGRDNNSNRVAEYTVRYGGNFNVVSVSYRTAERIFFVDMKSEAKAAGLKSIKSGFDDGLAYTDYEGKNMIIRFSTKKLYVGNTPVTSYEVHVYNKNYYQVNIRN